jgi:hypothetical protein
MPLIIAIVAALVAAAFWFYRLRVYGTVVHDVIDRAERLRGAYRRHRFRRQVENSPFSAVRDPATAATTMLVSLATVHGRMTPASEEFIRAELSAIVDPMVAEETFGVGSWLAGQASDPNDVSLRFSRLWLTALTPAERAQFYTMASRLIAIDQEPDDAQRQSLSRLKERLGLFRIGP